MPIPIPNPTQSCNILFRRCSEVCALKQQKKNKVTWIVAALCHCLHVIVCMIVYLNVCQSMYVSVGVHMQLCAIGDRWVCACVKVHVSVYMCMHVRVSTESL